MADSKYPQDSKSIMANSIENARNSVLKHTAKPFQAKVDAITAGQSPEAKADSIESATKTLADHQAVISQTPEQDREALNQQKQQELVERAQASNRNLSTGERLAMVFLGAAPAVAAAATGRGDIAAAAAAGNSSVNTIYGIHADENKKNIAQKDAEIASTQDRQHANDDVLKQQAAFTQQDKLDQRKGARDDQRAIAAEGRANKKATDAQAHYDTSLRERGIAYISGARTNPVARQLETSINRADSGLALLNAAALELTGGKRGLSELSDDEKVQAFNRVSPQNRKEVAGALDAMVKGGAGTVTGSHELEQRTAFGDLSAKARYLSGQDVDSGVGPLLMGTLNSFKVERETSRQKLMQHYKAADSIVAERLTDPTFANEWEKAKAQKIPKSFEEQFKAFPTEGSPQGNTAPVAHPEQDAALAWANSNPKDPRAAQIKQRLGVK